VEALVVIGLFVITVPEIAIDVAGPWRWLRAVVFGAAITLPLLLRRQAPMAAAATVAVAASVNAAVNGMSAGGPGPWLAFVLAAFAAGSHWVPWRAVAGWLIVATPVTVVGAGRAADGEDASVMFMPLLFLTAVWSVGLLAAHRRRRAAEVEQRSRELDRHADELAATAAERERSRIARELHDVVTHGMSVMVVQSQAAQSLAGTDANRAREAMRAVEEAGREALGEMRRLLGVIRGDPVAELAPQPRLDDVPGLVARVRKAGLPITCDFEGDSATVPAGVAVSAYRVVQEALTNVVKHAGPVPTNVRTAVADGTLEITVTNGPPAEAAAPAVGGGAGLAGMRERVAVYDGILEAGQSTDGGFRVRAIFPVGTP
jgi:signal transduction histidine kinase